MTLAIILAAIVFFIAVYAVAMRGGLGLLKQRLADEPELAKNIDDDKLDDGLPVDIEY